MTRRKRDRLRRRANFFKRYRGTARVLKQVRDPETEDEWILCKVRGRVAVWRKLHPYEIMSYQLTAALSDLKAATDDLRALGAKV